MEGTADEQDKRLTLLLRGKMEHGGRVKLHILLLETTPPSYCWSTETDFILCHHNGYQ